MWVAVRSSRVLLGRETGRGAPAVRRDGYLWLLFQPPLCDTPLPPRLAVGTASRGPAFAANCVSPGLPSPSNGSEQPGGRLASEGSDTYLHSAGCSSAPRRHTVSEASEEMKSPIIEKSKMGQEDDNELLVKGESPVVCVGFIFTLQPRVWTQPLISWLFCHSDDC